MTGEARERSLPAVVWALAACIVATAYLGYIGPHEATLTALRESERRATLETARDRAQLREAETIARARRRVEQTLRADAGGAGGDAGATVLASATAAGASSGAAVVSVAASGGGDVDLQVRGRFAALVRFLERFSNERAPIDVRSFDARSHPQRDGAPTTLDMHVSARPYRPAPASTEVPKHG